MVTTGSLNFVTVHFFFRDGVVAPRPTTNMEHQGLHFVWPLSFDLSGMGHYQELTLPPA
jgi:hypothetical protein